ncbi:hypothetical protein UlMin_025138 [Ulmus minor]
MEDSLDRRNRTKRAAATSEEEYGGNPEVWKSFNHNFHEVQSVLDRNRSLIRQVNENHQSRIPDNMVRNVALIQEINGNINKVVSMYSDLNSNFTSYFHDQRSPNGKPDSPAKR